MTATAVDLNTVSKNPGLKSYPIADNVKVYKGSIVAVDTNGYARPASDASGYVVKGVADEQVDNTLTGHAAGLKSVRVVSGRHFLMTCVSGTQARVGAVAYVQDDQTVVFSGQANNVILGEVTEYVSATQVWVYVPHNTLLPSLAAAVSASSIAAADASLDITGAAGSGAGAGGAVPIAGGVGGATGAGGVSSLTGGAGGSGSGTGGVSKIVGGAGTAGNSAGGASQVTGGAGQGSAAGGAATTAGGVGGATGAGGPATLTGGAGGSGSGTGGASSVIGGAGSAGNATGGIALLRGGAGQGTGAGAAAQVTGGASGAGATGNGGAVTITGGAAGSTDGNGGHVNLVGGALAGSGTAGEVQINGNAELIPIVLNYTASMVTQAFFTATRAMRVKKITGRTRVAGSGGACTLSFFKCASTVAVGSGTLLHTGTFNVVGAADLNQVLTPSATITDLELAAGDSIGYVLTGTPTSAVGSLTITAVPI